jgi:hypothetical protein
MDHFPTDRIFRSLALERAYGEKMVSQKNVPCNELKYR